MMRYSLLALPLCMLPLAAPAQDAAEEDRSFLAGLLEDSLSGAGRDVTIRGFQGALSSRATIREIVIADDAGVWLTLNDIVLDWNRTALLRGAIIVNELSAAEIIVARLPDTGSDDSLPAPEARGFSLPDLPVSVTIGALRADRIALGETILGQAYEGRLVADLTLAGGEGSGKLELDRTDGGPASRMALAGSYTNETRNLVIDLDAREAAGGIVTTLAGLPGAPPVELTVQGEGPLDDFAADLRLASEGQERLAGRVVLDGREVGQTRFNADLSGNMAPLFLPDYAEFFGDSLALVATGARHSDGRFDLEQLDFRTRAMTLAGSLALAADGLPESFALSGRIANPDGSPVLLPLTTEARTQIGGVDLALAFDASAGDGWTADITLDALERPDLALTQALLRGRGRILRPEQGMGARLDGQFDLTATGLAPRDTALAAALGPDLSAELHLLWQQGIDGLELPQLRLNGADFGFDGAITLQGLASALTVSGQGMARADDLSRFAALAGRPLAGALSADLSGEAALLAGSFDLEGQIRGRDLRIGQAEADSLLAGESQIALSVRRDETGTALRQLDLRAGTLSVQASGSIASTESDVTAKLDLTDLSVLGAGYGGAITGTAQFTGTPDLGQLSLQAAGDGLRIGQAEADNLLKGRSVITAKAELNGDRINLESLQVTAATLDLAARGQIAAEANDITATLGFSDLSALGAGYRGRLDAEARFTGTAEDGSLTASATGRNLAIGQTEADRILAGDTALSADLALAGSRVQVRSFTLENPQLSVAAQGRLDGAERQITLEAALANLALILPEFPGRLTLSGTAQQDAQGYQINLKGQGPGQIAADIAGRIAQDFGTANLRATGSAQAGLANVFIAPRNLAGALRFDLALNGALRPESVSGRITLADGRFSDPDLAFALENIAVTANLAGGRATIDARAAPTGGGNITLGGSLGMAAPYPADLSIRLAQAILRDPQLYETRLNGTVTVVGGLTGGARIGGEIVLSETELRVPDTGFGAASGLDDLRHVAEPAEVLATRRRAGLVAEAGSGTGGRTSGPAYPLDLLISAPQRVFIRGRGLDAEVGGQLRVQGTTANVVPSGAFDLVRGRLDILGKRLTLSRALVQLEGDFDPYLDILASNESDGITASVQIIGQASEPEVRFVSSPDLPEEEVLARLLFGRDLTSLSAFQAAQLASAVATLAGRGGEGIMSKLRRGFGLDDFDISTNAEGETSLTAGKYISQNTYTEIEVDQGGQATINLNLDLTDSITLRGSAADDGETSIGIFKEKDY